MYGRSLGNEKAGATLDNLITGIIGATIFLAFTIGLAVSIDKLPFTIIVGIVGVMMVVDLVQSVRDGFK